MAHVGTNEPGRQDGATPAQVVGGDALSMTHIAVCWFPAAAVRLWQRAGLTNATTEVITEQVQQTSDRPQLRL